MQTDKLCVCGAFSIDIDGIIMYNVSVDIFTFII